MAVLLRREPSLSFENIERNGIVIVRGTITASFRTRPASQILLKIHFFIDSNQVPSGLPANTSTANKKQFFLCYFNVLFHENLQQEKKTFSILINCTYFVVVDKYMCASQIAFTCQLFFFFMCITICTIAENHS